MYVNDFTDAADTLNPQNVTIVENSVLPSSMWIQWADPVTPNGLIVLYELELSRVEVSNVSCSLRSLLTVYGAVQI